MKLKLKNKNKVRFNKVENKVSIDKQNEKHPTKSRTKEEEILIRKKAYEFFFFKSLNNETKIIELGYEDMTDKSFIKKMGVANDYLSEIVHRDFFKQDYFDYVTNCISKDFAAYLIPTLKKGNEKAKAMQILLPDQVGRALTVRKIGVSGDADDEEFRNEFFGIKDKKNESKD